MSSGLFWCAVAFFVTLCPALFIRAAAVAAILIPIIVVAGGVLFITAGGPRSENPDCRAYYAAAAANFAKRGPRPSDAAPAAPLGCPDWRQHAAEQQAPSAAAGLTTIALLVAFVGLAARAARSYTTPHPAAPTVELDPALAKRMKYLERSAGSPRLIPGKPLRRSWGRRPPRRASGP